MWDKLRILREEYINQRIMDSIDYEKFCMISIVYNSSKIEGCSLTETDTKVLLENNITAQGKPLTDHLMVKDHFNAFIKIKQDAINKRKLSIEFIQEVNALVMKSTGAITNTISGNFDTSKESKDTKYGDTLEQKLYQGNGSQLLTILCLLPLHANSTNLP